MKTLKIINTFNFTSDEFIQIITSNDYYNFLKDNDDQFLDFKFESFNSNDNEINYYYIFKNITLIRQKFYHAVCESIEHIKENLWHFFRIFFYNF